MDKQIIVYEADKDHRIEVKTDGDTVWLTQEQMCQLFGRTQPVIARHIANVFKEGELPKEGFMQILHKTSQMGGRPTDGRGERRHQADQGRDELPRQAAVGSTGSAPQADRLWRRRRIDRQAIRQEVIEKGQICFPRCVETRVGLLRGITVNGTA